MLGLQALCWLLLCYSKWTFLTTDSYSLSLQFRQDLLFYKWISLYESIKSLYTGQPFHGLRVRWLTWHPLCRINYLVGLNVFWKDINDFLDPWTCFLQSPQLPRLHLKCPIESCVLRYWDMIDRGLTQRVP